MTRDHRFVAALLPLVTLACGSSPSAPGRSGSPTVSGRVLDFQANSGVPGASVVFADPSNTTTIVREGGAIADGSGSYETALMAGLYAAYIDNTYGGQVRIRAGVNHTDLLVRANGCIVRYGTIADAGTGRPIAGAAVSLVGVTTTTAADGTYRLDFGCRSGLWSGSIALSVTRVGYQSGGVPMGRGEGLSGVIRQDVDLAPA